MRNKWIDMRWLMFAVLAWNAPAFAAKAAPTAAGAQQYLAAMAQQVTTKVFFVDGSGRVNYVTGKYTGQVRTIKGRAFGKQKESVTTLPEQVVEKKVSDIHASVLEAIDAYGRPTACATRITEVAAPPYDETKSDAGNDTRAFSFTLTYKDEQWKYEPLTKFTTPAQVIDWSNVRVVRVSPAAVTVVSNGQAFAQVELAYFANDPDAADQIEYAMKFLALSCNANAAKGF
jgi:hypothetical protein